MVADTKISKKRTFTFSLELSDEDYIVTAKLAGAYGIGVDELLNVFLMDIAASTYSNGSDRMYARRYFDMRFQPEDTFLGYLIQNELVDEFVASYMLLEAYKMNHSGVELIEDQREKIQEYYQDYARNVWKPEIYEDAVEMVLKWWGDLTLSLARRI